MRLSGRELSEAEFDGLGAITKHESVCETIRDELARPEAERIPASLLGMVVGLLARPIK